MTKMGRVVDPSEGTKEMFTRDRLIGVESGIEPDVAWMRPQLCVMFSGVVGLAKEGHGGRTLRLLCRKRF